MKISLIIILTIVYITSAMSADKPPKYDDFDFWYDDLTTSNPTPVEESEDPNCNTNTLGQASKTFEVSCKPNWKKEKFCRCVRAEAENNVFVKINLTNQQALDEKVIEYQTANTKRFVSAYSQMTIEADIQEQVLGLDTKPVGTQIANCPPKQFAEDVKTNSEEHFKQQNILLNKMLDERKEALKGCKDWVAKKVSKGKGNDEAVKERIGKCAKLQDSITTIEMNLPNKSGEEMADMGCGQSATRLTKIALKTRLEIARAYYVETKNRPKEIATNDMIKSLDQDIVGCFAPGNSPTERASTFLVGFDQEYKLSGGATNREGQCDGLKDGTKELCTALENTNTALADELKKQYDFKPESECISFSEFKTFKGMPEPELMDAFTNASRFFSTDLLETPVNGSTELKRQRLNFLRANPLIAKVAQNEKSREALGEMLKKLGKSLEGKNDFEKFNAYLHFMKDEKKGLKSLLVKPEAQSTEMYICNQLTQNFTAIQVSNDLPQEEPDRDEDAFEANLRKIKGCQLDEHNELSVTKLEETLKASPIFLLAPEDVDAEKQKLKDEFNKFKGKYCEGYQSKIAGYKGTPEERRQQFLDHSPFHGYKEALDANGIVGGGTNIDWDEARRGTSEKRQDKVLQKLWNLHERPKLASSPVMLRGQENEFLEGLAKNRSSVGNSKSNKVESSGGSLKNLNNGNRSGKVEQVLNQLGNNAAPVMNEEMVNQGHFIPPFLNQPQTNEEVLNEFARNKEVLKELTEKDLVDLIENSKTAITKTNDPTEIKEHTEKISEYTKRLEEIKETPVARSIASEGTGTKVVEEVKTVQTYQQGEKKGKIATITQKIVDKVKASKNKALNQANEKGEIISVDANSDFIFNSTPIYLDGEIEVGVPLKASSETFNIAASGPVELENYLRQNLKEIPANQIISIKCTGKKCDKNSDEIFLQISKDENNKLVIRSISKGTKITRVHRRSDLTNTMEQITQ